MHPEVCVILVEQKVFLKKVTFNKVNLKVNPFIFISTLLERAYPIRHCIRCLID